MKNKKMSLFLSIFSLITMLLFLMYQRVSVSFSSITILIIIQTIFIVPLKNLFLKKEEYTKNEIYYLVLTISLAVSSIIIGKALGMYYDSYKIFGTKLSELYLKEQLALLFLVNIIPIFFSFGREQVKTKKDYKFNFIWLAFTSFLFIFGSGELFMQVISGVASLLAFSLLINNDYLKKQEEIILLILLVLNTITINLFNVVVLGYMILERKGKI